MKLVSAATPVAMTLLVLAAPASRAEDAVAVATGARIRVTTTDVIEVPGLALLSKDTSQVRSGGTSQLRRDTVVVQPLGEEARALARAGHRFAAVLLSQDDESLWLSVPEHEIPVQLPRSGLARLEVSTGQHRHVLRNFVVGAGLGVLLGQLLGRSEPTRCEGFTAECLGQAVGRGLNDAGTQVGLPILGGLVGFATGFIQTERWKPATLPPGPLPAEARRTSFSVSFRF